MHEQQMRKTPGQSFTPSIHEGDDPETRYRWRLTENNDRFFVDALADMESTRLKPVDVNVTVDDPAIRSIEWSLVRPDGSVAPGKIRTQRGDADATTKPFRLEPNQLALTGRYFLKCIGFDSADSMYLVAHRDFRVVGADLITLKETGGKHGLLTFTEYRLDQRTLPGTTVVRTEIDFLPNDAVTCPQVGWIQSVQVLFPDGLRAYQYMSNPELDARATPLSWIIDREAAPPSPFYGMEKNPKTGAIEMNPNKGYFGNTPEHDESMLHDDPVLKGPAAVAKYESCAVCRQGAEAGQVYACATWGFTTDGGLGVTLHPRGFSDEPSPQFRDATAKWNVWRSTVKKNQPEAAPVLRTP
jgi:hypothetical protein